MVELMCLAQKLGPQPPCTAIVLSPTKINFVALILFGGGIVMGGTWPWAWAALISAAADIKAFESMMARPFRIAKAQVALRAISVYVAQKPVSSYIV